MHDIDIRHFHLFAGLGGGARGFNRGQARVGSMRARFRCLGGIDVDPSACRDFERLAGVPATCLDLMDREQFKDFHGHEPPADWREATPQDIQAAAGHERPHIVFLSAPCKGFSGLLSQRKSTTAKYRALNRLTLRGVWLMLEAWADDPPELVVFENVPRIQTRGRPLLDQIGELLRSYGYAVAETTHDCGELGGLAQSRKRFLLVARHREKVPPFLYEPHKRPLKAVGDVLERFPLPGDPAAGPMHRVPRLQWQTWVRLAFVEAGSDWRSLNRLAVQDGVLADYCIVPEGWHHGALVVLPWAGPAGAVTSASRPMCGRFSVADPRAFNRRGDYLGCIPWQNSTGAVTSRGGPTNGRFAVADPRLPDSNPNRHYNLYRIVPWAEAAGTVTGASHAANGRMAVADPRREGPTYGKYPVTPWTNPAGTVISGSTTGQGAFAVGDPRFPWKDAHRNKLAIMPWDGHGRTVTGSNRVGSGALSVADPRPAAWQDGKADYLTGGHYGVVPWDAPSGAVVAHAKHDRGPFSVADVRLPEPRQQLVAVIRSLDDTWHRPFTTLELAALQGLVDPEEHMELEGLADAAWRERIGNAVPPPAAQAIAGVMGTTLLLAMSGETFSMGNTPIWVRPVTAALMAAQGEG